MNDSNLVYQTVSKIPKGKVATYNVISNLTGVNPRVVGNILHKNKDSENIPCHRVVNSKGIVAQNYAFGGASAQVVRLKKEGIDFTDNRVKLAYHLWQPDELLFWYFRLLSFFLINPTGIIQRK